MVKKFKRLAAATILALGLVACGDNNEGPFEWRKLDGVRTLYSAGKLAKGHVKRTRNNNGDTYLVSEVYYDKGIPAGDFILYDKDANPIVKATGKFDGNIFNGKIIQQAIVRALGIENEFEAEGVFSINRNFISDYSAKDAYSCFTFVEQTLVDGTIKKSTLDGIPAYEKSFANQELDGPFKEYYEDGTLKIKTNYLKGEFNGKYENYYDNGQLEVEANYLAGVLDGKCVSYFRNGNVGEEITYSSGIVTGKVKKYYENGKLYFTGSFDENGQYHGRYKEYYDNGQLYKKGNFKHGEPDGKFEYYNREGKLEITNVFKDGVLLETTKK